MRIFGRPSNPAMRHGHRALVGEILSLQLLFTAVIGLLAIAGLYGLSQWVLQENLNRWATQWTGELNELGAPLYLRDNANVTLEVEQFIQKYPEIGSVGYYGIEGNHLFSLSSNHLGPSHDENLSVDVRQELLQQFESEGGNGPVRKKLKHEQTFEIIGLISVESINDDGLFAYTPQGATPSRKTPIGFIKLALDFSWYQERLLVNLVYACLVLLVLLISSGLLGWKFLKRSLSSLSDLQRPISELAQGNLEVEFQPSAHREIAAIVDTLESTAAALRERDATLSKLANHDALTGLFNRRRFVEELKREVRVCSKKGRVSALFFVDLDQFKYVNDTCGHPAGDRLLKLAAQQLRSSIRSKDCVARFGGDEFAIITRDVTRKEAKTLANSVLRDMRKLSHMENGQIFHLQCSIGISMIRSDRFSPNELLAQADIACHEAKSRGRNRLEFYKIANKETEQMAVDVGWMGMIRNAIDNDGFLFHYQPIVNIATGEATHMEVLLRMRSSDGGLIAPDAFLPAAARFGLMADIDDWTLTHALRQLAEFRHNDPELRFTLNLSAHAFESATLVDKVKGLLKELDLPPGAVIFEITEQFAVRHLNDVEKQINAIRALGCEFAIDDFGTGYSSFSYLKNLPVDYLKIDGSFVQNLDKDPVDQTMVRLIAEIGRAAGLKTIAEYVQSGPALALLAKYGIDYAQGFYVGRPMEYPDRKEFPITLDSLRHRRGLA
ncbi:MAG: EAL domain-containing protein [Pseudomonadota bacterium]